MFRGNQENLSQLISTALKQWKILLEERNLIPQSIANRSFANCGFQVSMDFHLNPVLPTAKYLVLSFHRFSISDCSC